MLMWSIIASLIFTVIILLLTLLTIQQGYGYKHTIDPPVNKENEQRGKNEEQS